MIERFKQMSWINSFFDLLPETGLIKGKFCRKRIMVISRE